METFPNVWTQFFPLFFKYHFIEANTRLGPGCLRSHLRFAMLLSLSCQRHVCWTNIWKMCFLPNFTVFHHARIYFTERCLLKMVLGWFLELPKNKWKQHQEPNMLYTECNTHHKNFPKKRSPWWDSTTLSTLSQRKSSDNGINTKATELHLGLDNVSELKIFRNIRHTFRHFMYLYDKICY